jgi:iron complex transport system substrate-binding protein
MPRARAVLVIAAFAILACLQPGAAGAADGKRPARVVSLNLCTDQLVLELLERERIASISFLGADPRYSAVADRARGIPRNHGRAEEVLRLDPDLVLAGTYTSRATVALLRRLDYRVVEMAPPRDIPAVRAQIRRIADVLGVSKRGEALIRAFDRKLRAAAPAGAGARPSAVIYEANGIAVGDGELADAAVEAAGLSNLAAEMGLRGPSPLSLEHLVVARPDVLILQNHGENAPSQATHLLDHPALRHLRKLTAVAVVPEALWTCGGPQLAEAVARLAEARRAVEREGG